MDLRRRPTGTSGATADDRRSEARLQVGRDVRVTLLLEDSDTVLTGTVRDVSLRGVSLMLGRTVRPGTAVRLDISGKMLLGEVVHCTEKDRAYLVGVELQQAVTWTRDLIQLLEALRTDDSKLP